MCVCEREEFVFAKRDKAVGLETKGCECNVDEQTLPKLFLLVNEMQPREEFRGMRCMVGGGSVMLR